MLVIRLRNNTKKPKLYIAAPLFSQMEQQYNASLKRGLEDIFDVFLPQEDGGLLIDLIRQGADVRFASEKVFRIDLDAIAQADVVLVVLDGRTVDEGACFELGFAYAAQKVCVGLQTDSRRLFPFGNNPMIENALSNVFDSFSSLRSWAETFSKG